MTALQITVALTWTFIALCKLLSASKEPTRWHDIVDGVSVLVQASVVTALAIATADVLKDVLL